MCVHFNTIVFPAVLPGGIHDLVAFQDPNSVPVASFYRSDARVNYFAKLSLDNNVTVTIASRSCVV